MERIATATKCLFRVVVTAEPSPDQVDKVHDLLRSAAVFAAMRAEVPATERLGVACATLSDLATGIRGEVVDEGTAHCVGAALRTTGVAYRVEAA